MAEATAASQFGPFAVVLRCCCWFWMFLDLQIKVIIYYGVCLVCVKAYQKYFISKSK